ncbi:MAG: hypothetical protein GY739_04555, partial [Mesoflavibacter sp.]|nr:hypothetical protein [Mesoflavibacter sp.]
VRLALEVERLQRDNRRRDEELRGAQAEDERRQQEPGRAELRRLTDRLARLENQMRRHPDYEGGEEWR